MFPIKETEYIEREIEQENFTLLFNDGFSAKVLFPESKANKCYKCENFGMVVLTIKPNSSNWSEKNFCLECSLNGQFIEQDFLKNPEIVNEIIEFLNYREKSNREKSEYLIK